MAVNRRGFLRGLMASPFAAGKAKADVESQLATGLGENVFPGGVVETASASTPTITPEALKVLGIPDFVKSDWEVRARQVRHLDPDLAACQSFSLSAKICIQAKREYERQERGFWDSMFRGSVVENWQKKHGRIPWW